LRRKTVNGTSRTLFAMAAVVGKALDFDQHFCMIALTEWGAPDELSVK